MFFLSSVFISSLFHFGDDLDQTKDTKKTNERNLDVDDLEDEGYQDNDRIKNIDEDKKPWKTIGEDLQTYFNDKEGKEKVINNVVNLSNNVSFSCFHISIKVVWHRHL